MTRIRKKKQPLLPDKKERCSSPRSHGCLRTECLVSSVLVGLLALFVTWGSSAIVNAGYELVQARACLTKLEKQNELLRLDMTQLKSPQRIQGIAEGELGMMKPQTVYMVAKAQTGNKPVQDEKPEASSGQSAGLFGKALAEAHSILE